MCKTSSNYNDAADRTVAGLNGLGVKLTNIFSSTFRVRVRHAATGDSYTQEWTDQMGTVGAPEVRAGSKPAPGFVEVTFQPVPALLGAAGCISGDACELLMARAMEVALAAPKGTKVHFNGTLLKCDTLSKFMEALYPSGGEDRFSAVDNSDPNWVVGVVHATHAATHGLVNGVGANAGSHVTYFRARLMPALLEAIKGKRGDKGGAVSAASLDAHSAWFVVARVNRPAFDSQCKEKLVSCERLSDYTPSKAFVEKIAGSPIAAAAMEDERMKMSKKLARATDGKKTAKVSVAKLIDAAWAGTARSGQTALILTEGDSARTFAVSGLSVLGHDKYGVFPLKGKLLNVREASAEQLTKNEEIKNLKTILGLQESKTHAGGEGLRYGSVIVLTDADYDGSHIRGLVLNFLHAKWPVLAKSGFVRILQTPVVRATRGSNTRDFVNLNDLNAWLGTDGSSGWRLKFYKGLGTWDAASAKKLLGAALPVRMVDCDAADESMALAFDAKKADERKEWILANVAQPPSPDYASPTMTVEAFVNKDLINYSIYSVQRALPSMLDGMKTGQRKVLFAVFDRGYITRAKEIKVAQLAGAVAERTLYLHGEASLNTTIVNMAQDFTGSNNLNLLVPNGAFGTRLASGKDAASPRYVYTYAAPAARILFNTEDDALLTPMKEEGIDVEPQAFWPVLPMLLINGSAAIATGFSTTVPTFNPGDVLGNVKRMLDDQEPEPMTPWFRGFTGSVVQTSEGKWKVTGVLKSSRPGQEAQEYVITELPPTMAFNTYAEWLESSKSPARLVENKCTDTRPHFKVSFPAPVSEGAAAAALKLSENVSATNMHVFDADGRIKKYTSAEAIMADWYPWRLARYEDRRRSLITKLENLALEHESKARFVRAVVAKEIDLSAHKECDLLALLRGNDYVAPEKLIELPAKSFTMDRAAEAERRAASARTEARRVASLTAKDMWRTDLAALETALRSL